MRKEGIWAKHMALSQGVIGNTVGGTHQELREHIGNLMGTHWELESNMLGTNGKMGIIFHCWEKKLMHFCNTFF